MNDFDRDNLHFILDSDEQTLKEFYAWASTEDLHYMLSVVQTAKAELLLQELEILDEVEDLSEASDLLKKYRS